MNWVRAYFDCSTDHAWLALRTQIRRDVDAYKELAGSLPGSPVEASYSDVQVTVSRRTTDSKVWVTVSLSGNAIVILTPNADNPNRPKAAHVLPRVNNAGECRLVIEGDEEEWEFWQVSRRILTPVLFFTM